MAFGCIPSDRPTVRATVRPSDRPTARPSVRPSDRPTVRPSARPTVRPSVRPPDRPSDRPSVCPTVRPSDTRRFISIALCMRAVSFLENRCNDFRCQKSAKGGMATLTTDGDW